MFAQWLKSLDNCAFPGAPGIPNNPGAEGSIPGSAAGLKSKNKFVLIGFDWLVPLWVVNFFKIEV